MIICGPLSLIPTHKESLKKKHKEMESHENYDLYIVFYHVPICLSTIYIFFLFFLFISSTVCVI